MNPKACPNLVADDLLSELAVLGMRAARVIAAMMEIEQAAAAVAAGCLPAAGVEPASLAEAIAAGEGADGVAAVMAEAVPRVEVLARALDRVSRSVRRSVALLRRLEAGWPRAGSVDDRRAMERRQVARGVGEAIRRGAEGEAAERLFDELAERLDDPGLDEETLVLPVAEVVRRICRDLGLSMERVRGTVGEMPDAEAGVPGVDTG